MINAQVTDLNGIIKLFGEELDQRREDSAASQLSYLNVSKSSVEMTAKLIRSMTKEINDFNHIQYMHKDLTVQDCLNHRP